MKFMDFETNASYNENLGNSKLYAVNQRTDFCIRQPSTEEELMSCFKIIHDEYSKLGYIEPNYSQVHLTPHALFPNSKTALVECNGEITYTGTFVVNSFLGLPAQSTFGEVFKSLEEQGRLIAEGTLFAGRSSTAVSVATLPKLLTYTIAEMINLGLDDFLIVVNPSHVPFWTSYFGFEILTEERACSHVDYTPGILLRLDLRKALITDSLPGRFGKTINLGHLLEEHQCYHSNPINKDLIHKIFSIYPQLLRQMNNTQLKYFQNLYPEIFLKFESELPLAA